MAAFEYQALDENGRKKKGVLEGDSPRQIRQLLKEKSWIPLEVQLSEQKEKKAAQSTSFFNFGPRSIKAKDLALVTRQLSTLIQSGLAVEEALRAISQQSRNQRITSMMLAVRAKVVEGHSLAAAMAEFPGSFSDMYRATVASGEHSGHLDAVLERLAEYTEDKEVTQGEVKKAMIQPTILISFSILILWGLLNKVVPKIVGIFEGEGAQLPLPTRILLAVSEFTQNYLLYLVVIFIGAFIFFQYQMRRNENFRRVIHKLYLKMPFLSMFVLGNDIERFSSTLAILARSGVPLVEAIKISQQVVVNIPIREAVDAACIAVSEGGSLSRALMKSEYFPPMLVQMIASGESSGELDQMLERASKNQQRELSSLVSNSLALFAPAMTIIMAGMVLMIVMAIMLPMISMNQMIG